MRTFSALIALSLAATGALAETEDYTQAREALTRTVVPAAQDLAKALSEFQQNDLDNGRLVALIGIAPGAPRTARLGFVCPQEFGTEACDEVSTFFRAIGGSCLEDTPFGTVCEGPDGPEVPIPD